MTQLSSNDVKYLRSLFPGVDIANNTKLLGSGVGGNVYNIGNNRILKYIKGSGHHRGVLESRYQKIAGIAGLAPKILENYNENITTKGGFFIMQKLPPNTITAHDYHKLVKGKSPNGQRQALVAKEFHNLHTLGISHGNAHASNIMFTIDPNTLKIKKVWIIDFGSSSVIPAGKTEKNVYDNYHPYNIPGFPGTVAAYNGKPVRPNSFMIPGLPPRGKKFSTINRRAIGGTLRIEAADPNNLRNNHSKGPPKRSLNLLGGNIFGPQSPKRRPATAGGRLFRFFK
jgi:predicted Ser/Thr protein kinase